MGTTVGEHRPGNGSAASTAGNASTVIIYDLSEVFADWLICRRGLTEDLLIIIAAHTCHGSHRVGRIVLV